MTSASFHDSIIVIPPLFALEESLMNMPITNTRITVASTIVIAAGHFAVILSCCVSYRTVANIQNEWQTFKDVPSHCVFGIECIANRWIKIPFGIKIFESVKLMSLQKVTQTWVSNRQVSRNELMSNSLEYCIWLLQIASFWVSSFLIQFPRQFSSSSVNWVDQLSLISLRFPS